jgi:hypothetical protein
METREGFRGILTAPNFEGCFAFLLLDHHLASNLGIHLDTTTESLDENPRLGEVDRLSYLHV